MNTTVVAAEPPPDPTTATTTTAVLQPGVAFAWNTNDTPEQLIPLTGYLDLASREN